MKRLSFGLCVAVCASLATADSTRAQDFFSNLFGGGGWPAQRRAAPRPVEQKAQKAAPKKKPAPKQQPQQAAPAPGGAAAPAVADGPPPPYEPQLLRLSEILGALAYLRDLCGKDGDDWRAKMSTLLDAEAKAGPRRQKLAGAFNRGFHGYQTTYHACTPNAESAISRYVQEGGRLAHEITYRYGNS